MPTTKSLTELVFAVHFDAPLPLNLMDIANWADHFAPNFTIVQQLPALNRASLDPAFQMQFEMLAPDNLPLPRLLLRSSDSRYSIQLQSDRFAFGWARIEPLGQPDEYPGFDEVRADWMRMLTRFDEWTKSRFNLTTNARLIELSYTNAALLIVDGKQRRISDLFKFVKPAGRRLHNFSVNWMEPIGSEKHDISTARIAAQVALGMAPPAEPVLVFNFSGLGTVVSREESDHMLSDLHTKIREMYENTIVSDAI